MKLVLLSGGSGKRLWPLSNDCRSKQFIRILKEVNGSELESMVQRVWKQLDRVDLAHHSYVATGKSQTELIQNQLENRASIIVEPERRDTYPAILLAASYLYSIEGVSLQESIAVLPVDPYVDDAFFLKVKELDGTLNDYQADLALIGVKPTYPSEKYGYIVPTSDNILDDSIKVSHFHEKPTEEQANQLIQQNAYWNCGVFAFKLDYLITHMRERNFPLHYDELVKQYNNLPKISFDYEVVEKSKNIIMLPYEGYWKDLGTWNTLTEEMDETIIGKGVLSDDSLNTHIVNELDIPVTVLGVSNAIIAVSPDGILISDKASSPKVKDLMKNYEQRPMFEERRWGWYKVLDYARNDEGKEVITRRICISPNSNLSYQVHKERIEIWTVICGKGELILDGILQEIQTGDVIRILAGVKHSVRAITNLEIIENQIADNLNQEDIQRISMNWEEILDYSSNRVG
jgi:mannose-1-phosphate guanylyltransferase